MERDTVILIAFGVFCLGLLLGTLLMHIINFKETKNLVKTIRSLVKEMTFEGIEDGDYVIGVRNGLRMAVSFITMDVITELEPTPTLKKMMKEIMEKKQKEQETKE